MKKFATFTIAVILIWSCTKEKAVLTSLQQRCVVTSEDQMENINGIRIENSTEYTYDQLNRLIGTVQNSKILSFKTITESKSYEHDAFGNPIYYETFIDNSLSSKYTASFVAFEKPTFIMTEQIGNSGSSKTEWTYNASGFENGRKKYADGILSKEWKNYEHNAFGEVTYYEIFEGTTKVKTVSRTFTTSHKLLTEEELVVSSGFGSKIENTYDMSGNLSNSKQYSGSLLVLETKEYEHDAAGNITGYKTYTASGDLFSTYNATFYCFDVPY